MDADAEAYNCDACPVADALAELDSDPAAAEAWRLFHQSVTRFTVDAHVTGSVLLKLVGDRDPDDLADLMGRISVIYDALCPMPEKKES